MVQIGDRIEVESEKVGHPSQGGVVTGTEGPLIQVRWDSGRESAFLPAAGSLRVVSHGAERRDRDRQP